MHFRIFQLSLVVVLSMMVGCRPMASKTDDEIYESIDAFYDSGEFAEAVRYCDVAIGREPHNHVPYVARSQCYVALDELDKALADANYAVELGPTKYDAYQARADVWSAMKEHQKAVDDVTKAMELQPNYFVHFVNRGFEFEMLGKYHEALHDYVQALKLNRDDSMAWNNYASLRSMAPEEYLRNGAKAVAAAKQAIKFAENDEDLAYAWDTLGAAYAETGDFERAIKAAKRALPYANDEFKNEITARMERYEQGEPARLPTQNDKQDVATATP